MVNCGTVDVLAADPGSNVTMDSCGSSDQVGPGEQMDFTADVTNGNASDVTVGVIWRLNGTDTVSQEQTISGGGSASTISQSLPHSALPVDPGTMGVAVTAEIVDVSFSQFVANATPCPSCGPKGNSTVSDSIASAGIGR